MIVSAVTVNVEKLVMPMMLAVTAIAAAAFVDSSATGLDHLPRLYLSQAAISFSAMFFLGPALVFGITSALQKGTRELLSFIVLFGAVNSIGALSGHALFGTLIDTTVTNSKDWVLAHQNALRLAAVLSLITVLYLAVLLTIRVRHKLAEIHRQKAAPSAGADTVDPPAGIKRPIGTRWHPPSVSSPDRLLLSATAAVGAVLLLSAVWLPAR